MMLRLVLALLLVEAKNGRLLREQKTSSNVGGLQRKKSTMTDRCV